MFNKIKNELEKLNIGLVYLFGSRVQGLAKKDSDMDIGIVFVEPVENARLLLIFEKLYSLFSQQRTGNRKLKLTLFFYNPHLCRFNLTPLNTARWHMRFLQNSERLMKKK
ncbi:MAG: nucleotidyltransferase domain-containing protein [bacterium]